MSDRQTRALLCELLRLFYDHGWASGTGGGICGPSDDGNMFLAPTGVHKERVQPEDLFVVSPADGSIVVPAADPTLRPSECGGVFRACIRARGARSVAHSHALSTVLAADIADGDALTIERFEMLKGIPGVANSDVHHVPVIDNTAREADLVAGVEKALADERFGSTRCVLVQDHGAYIWGDDVWEAKRHTEVYHWLFDAVLARRGGGGA